MEGKSRSSIPTSQAIASNNSSRFQSIALKRYSISGTSAEALTGRRWIVSLALGNIRSVDACCKTFTDTSCRESAQAASVILKTYGLPEAVITIASCIFKFNFCKQAELKN
jgi:hypothetical protein